MAAAPRISVYPLFEKAWTLTVKHARILLAYGLTLLGSQVLLFYVAELFGRGSTGYLAVHMAAVLIHAFFQVALTRALLRLVRNKKITFSDLFWVEPEALVWYLVASVYYLVAIAAGLVAFVVPGIMLGLLYSQYLCVIIDKKVHAVAALEQSVRLTKHQIPALFEFAGISILLLLFGTMLLGIGLVVALPVVTVGAFLLYEELKAKSRA